MFKRISVTNNHCYCVGIMQQLYCKPSLNQYDSVYFLFFNKLNKFSKRLNKDFIPNKNEKIAIWMAKNGSWSFAYFVQVAKTDRLRISQM